MDVFWERVFWFLMVSACGGIAWIARSILRPWSDAALMRARAFNEMVEVLQKSVPAIQGELGVLKTASALSNAALMQSTNAIAANTEAADQQTAAIKQHVERMDKWGSDPFAKVCKSDESKKEIVANQAEMITRNDEAVKLLKDIRNLIGDLKRQGQKSAIEMEKKAIILTTIVDPDGTQHDLDRPPTGDDVGHGMHKEE